MNLEFRDNPAEGGIESRVTISAAEVSERRKDIVDRINELVSVKLAEKFVEDHGIAILSSLSPKAVANLAIARAAKVFADSVGK